MVILPATTLALVTVKLEALVLELMIDAVASAICNVGNVRVAWRSKTAPEPITKPLVPPKELELVATKVPPAIVVKPV